jgi:CRISPR-associated endonuclease/helicase Cas3
MTAEPDHVRFIAHFRDRVPKEQSLEDHLIGVSRLTAGFAAKIGLREQGELLGLLHDFGKYSAEFQNYLKSAVGLLNQDEDEDWVDAKSRKGRVDHSTAGAQFVWQALAAKGALERSIGQIFSLCIARIALER